ncbi:hypothetical protein [Prolixibacter denitrificans]|uniref:Uncharacterized protein n=1 Tax=Prolixibacter denitrificans TaxID=1541063 RepID=A0A2P8CBS1_9BACT|nr:hypothetical protein [Prolixibacter denitrificans]PSK82416.1 hypothetical protein CLV93_106164 [Prolixibacter denitrificans]
MKMRVDSICHHKANARGISSVGVHQTRLSPNRKEGMDICFRPGKEMKEALEKATFAPR